MSTLQQLWHRLFPPSEPDIVTETVLLPTGHRVRLRSLCYQDGTYWRRYRLQDQAQLEAAEPTLGVSWHQAHTRSAWMRSYSYLQELTAAGDIVPLAIEVDGAFAGQISVGAILAAADPAEASGDPFAAQRPVIAAPCWVGYWLASEYQGLGIATAACALICDYALDVLHLRELSATCLPRNIASQKVLEHTGFFRDYGRNPRLHIAGQLQEHYFYTLAAGDYRTSCVHRLAKAGRIRRAPAQR